MANYVDSSSLPKLTPATLWLMTIGSGLVVANNYYNQPLLGLMAEDFQVSESQISNIAIFTQIGYACGLFFFIPLGDMMKRKRMIMFDFFFIITALLAMGLSRSVTLLFPISFIIGFTSVIPQLFVPMAATLSSPENRPKSIGMVMSGLLVGVLASRVLSGYIGNVLGWREMYFIAAFLMFILWGLIGLKLPEIMPTFKGSYKSLMLSIINLFKSNYNLRVASFRGALGFASLSAFWTPLVFHLQNNFHLTDQEASHIAGNFGIVGAGGAVAAAFIGRIINNFNKSHLFLFFIGFMILSWLIFGFSGTTYMGLIAGVILIDIGLQGSHIVNQSIIFSSAPEASNRVNTVYMTLYFIGGSAGSFFSAQAFGVYGWLGVVGVGGALAVLMLIIHLLFSKK